MLMSASVATPVKDPGSNSSTAGGQGVDLKNQPGELARLCEAMAGRRG
jgi:hypothetical protein